MKVSFLQPAPIGCIFMPDAFNSSIGKEIDVQFPDRTLTKGRIVAAKVAADGNTVRLTAEVADGVVTSAELANNLLGLRIED